MTFKINENTTALLKVNGVEIPFDAGNTLHVMHIAGGSSTILPSLHLEFTDMLNVLSELGLQDGSQVEVTINSVHSITRKFRVIGWHRPPAAEGFSYSIDAVWDAPRYWAGTANRSMEGASSSVLKTIAEECGISWYSRNTKTSDSQRWLPSNATWGTFSQFIARHGYVSDGSHMVMGIDTEGTMRYLDINSLAPPAITLANLPTSANNTLVISDFLPRTRSGINNLVGGYRYERVNQSLFTLERPTESEASTPSDSRSPLINKSVRELQQQGRVLYSPIDVGNTHPKFERAGYQNSRFDLINSSIGEFLTPTQTRLEFGTNFKYVSPATMSNRMYDGEFTIVSKVVYIAGGLYQEKFVAVKHGVET